MATDDAAGRRRRPRLCTFRTVELVVNGQPIDVPDGASVADLLGRLDLGSRWVVVERNGEPVDRRDHAAVVLAAGDRLEIVRAVAGG